MRESDGGWIERWIRDPEGTEVVGLESLRDGIGMALLSFQKAGRWKSKAFGSSSKFKLENIAVYLIFFPVGYSSLVV